MLCLCTRVLTKITRFQHFSFVKPRRTKRFLSSVQTSIKPANAPRSRFTDFENAHIYKILQTIPVVEKDLYTFVPCDRLVTTLDDFNSVLDQNWKVKTATEIVNVFKSVSSFCVNNNIDVSDTRFDKLVDGLMDNVQNLTDNELSDLLTCLSEYPPCEAYTSHNFHDIWSALDDVCCWRVKDWPNTTMFWFAERWYKYNLSKKCKFITNFLDIIDSKVNSLTKTQLIHGCFYKNLCRKHNIRFSYEKALDKFIYNLNADEMAVIALGYFKSKTRIQMKFQLQHIIRQVQSERHTISDITLAAILKVLRYSNYVLLVDQLVNLLDHLVPEIDRLSLVACTHIALLGTTLQFLHKESLTKVSQRLVQNIKEARLKEMERLLLPLTMFRFDPQTSPDIFAAIYDELHKDERLRESEIYLRCLPAILHYLSIRGTYSYKLIDHVLDPNYIVNVYGRNPRDLGRDILALDVSVDIECPDYTGNRLNKEHRYKATKWQIEYIPQHNQPYKLTQADRFALEVMDIVIDIIKKPEYLHWNHILPTYVKGDIIICKNAKGAFVKPDGFEQYTIGDIMRPPNANLKYYAIIPMHGNVTIRDTNEPLGLYSMKCRQLKKIGYEPIPVIGNEFYLLNKDQKLKYISSKIV